MSREEADKRAVIAQHAYELGLGQAMWEGTPDNLFSWILETHSELQWLWPAVSIIERQKHIMAARVRCLVGALQSYRETNNLLTIAIRDRCGWLSIMEGYRASQWCNLPLATQLFPSLEAGEVHFLFLIKGWATFAFLPWGRGSNKLRSVPTNKSNR